MVGSKDVYVLYFVSRTRISIKHIVFIVCGKNIGKYRDRKKDGLTITLLIGASIDKTRSKLETTKQIEVSQII